MKTADPLNKVETAYFDKTITEPFEGLEDSCQDRTKRHKLWDLSFIAISAAICGADNWKTVEVFVKAKKKWLETILELPSEVSQPCDFFGACFEGGEIKLQKALPRNFSIITDKSLVETTFSRLKKLFGDRFQSQTLRKSLCGSAPKILGSQQNDGSLIN